MVFNISSCHSHNSTSIITSNINQPSPPPPPPPPPPLTYGGRALDRHNPIITNAKRTGIRSIPDSSTPLGPPHPRHHVLVQQKPEPKPKPKTKTKNNARKSDFCKPSNVITTKAGSCNTSKAGVDYISPLESSSRYLLDDDTSNNIFLDDVLSNNNDISASGGVANSVEVTKFDANNLSKLLARCNKPPTSSSSDGSSDQVVLLRVSLHCRACERKLKKHLSTMPGVTSFDIDFGAKKVTVVGDVTPLQVLSSISKVKTAKFWSTTNMPPSSHFSTRTKQVATK